MWARFLPSRVARRIQTRAPRLFGSAGNSSRPHTRFSKISVSDTLRPISLPQVSQCSVILDDRLVPYTAGRWGPLGLAGACGGTACVEVWSFRSAGALIGAFVVLFRWQVRSRQRLPPQPLPIRRAAIQAGHCRQGTARPLRQKSPAGKPPKISISRPEVSGDPVAPFHVVTYFPGQALRRCIVFGRAFDCKQSGHRMRRLISHPAVPARRMLR
ncbi:hypothetical protein J2S92_000202 [Arthrobacter bambusae]|nr:hypothetical protein [Arthrobacter bambusae]MDQ0234129.1 hypothetical protein [Arthrobacter bambusae]